MHRLDLLQDLVGLELLRQQLHLVLSVEQLLLQPEGLVLQLEVLLLHRTVFRLRTALGERVSLGRHLVVLEADGLLGSPDLGHRAFLDEFLDLHLVLLDDQVLLEDGLDEDLLFL